MNTKQISLKASSKKELYRMLQLEGDAYLPPLPQANHKYVAGVISGKIKVCIHLSLLVCQKQLSEVNTSATFAKPTSSWHLDIRKREAWDRQIFANI